MPRPDVDELFAALRRAPDAETLAKLFERLAPWLLHHARRLLGQASLAEDVVQDLFLGLLEKGHGCEPGRPCRPYLLGVLHRRVGRIRRQQSRTLAQGLRDAAGAGAEPVEAAMTAEVRASIRRAIDALPEPYRDVVRRSLVQQSPSAIGRALGRTPNAVRVQLHRGLRLLRAALPPGLGVLLCAAPARPATVAHERGPRRGGHVAALAAAVAIAALATVLATGRPEVAPVAARITAGPPATLAPSAPVGDAGGPAAGARTAIATPAGPSLALALRHGDGSPAAGVGVLAHRAGRDADFGAVRAVSGADGRIVLRDLEAGPVTVVVDRGVRLDGDVPPPGAAPLPPRVVELPVGLEVAGIVRDAAGRPAAGAGIWLCSDPGTPAEGGVVARTGADGRFVLRDVPAQAALAAVRAGAVPSRLLALGRPADPAVDADAGASRRDVELVLGGSGARLRGRVLDGAGRPVAGAIVRLARQPRANLVLPGACDLGDVFPCAIVQTDGAGEFAFADLPAGPSQLLARSPRHVAALRPVALAAGAEARIEVRLRDGFELTGRVRDPDGLGVAGASVLARGPVRSAWAAVRTAADGSFALAGLDAAGTAIEVRAPGLLPFVQLLDGDFGPLDVLLQRESCIVLRLVDESATPVAATGWEVAAWPDGGQALEPRRLEPAGDAFVAAGELALGPFLVRRRGTPVWLRARSCDAGPGLVHVPASLASGPLVLSLSGAAAERRRDLRLALERDGIPHALLPEDASSPRVVVGRVPVGEYRAVVHWRAGCLPVVDLGDVTVRADGEPLVVAVPDHGHLQLRLRRTDGEPVQDHVAFAIDERGLRVPLSAADERVALAPGRYLLWAASPSFPAFAQPFEIAAGQETLLDLHVTPGAMRHLVFRLPAGADPGRCRARVRPDGESCPEGEPGFPLDDRGFDAAADGSCRTALVLAVGAYRLEVQCGARTVHGRFLVAGADGVAEPIEVALGDRP